MRRLQRPGQSTTLSSSHRKQVVEYLYLFFFVLFGCVPSLTFFFKNSTHMMIDSPEYQIPTPPLLTHNFFFFCRDLGVGVGLETREKTAPRHVTRARKGRAKGIIYIYTYIFNKNTWPHDGREKEKKLIISTLGKSDLICVCLERCNLYLACMSLTHANEFDCLWSSSYVTDRLHGDENTRVSSVLQLLRL